MLVLTRKRDEKIFIGPDITLTVVDVRGDKVRLGLDAPGMIRIARAELGQPEVPASPVVTKET